MLLAVKESQLGTVAVVDGGLPNDDYLESRTKVFYSALDGLRGIAAIGVALFHLANWTSVQNFFPRGDLAVDFFFCLSGFVLAHAYSHRLGAGMTFCEFAITRIIRLYPMLLFSVVLATAYFVGKSLLTAEIIPLFDVLASGAAAALVLPYFGSSVPLSGQYEAFPVNGPLWSLFFEFFISFAWAAILAVLTFRRTLALAGLCAVLLLIGAFIHDDLLIGDQTSDFVWGFPRVGVSFMLGLAVHHIHTQKWISLRLPLIVVCVLLILSLMVPRTIGVWDILFDALFVYVISPFIVLTGAAITLSGRLKTAADIGGELSYPIYVLHFPIFAWLNGGLQMAGIMLPIWISITLFFLCIILGSWLAMVWFERPVRRLLNHRKKTKNWPVVIQSNVTRLFRWNVPKL